MAHEANILPWGVLSEAMSSPDNTPPGVADIYTDLDTTRLEEVESEATLRQFLLHIDPTRRVPAQEMADREVHLLITGDPGSGKSTFVKHMAYLLASAAQSQDADVVLARLTPWSHGPLLPVYVELRGVAAYAAEHKVHQGTVRLFKQYLRAAVRRRDHRSLARRPILLTMMVQLHTFKGRLPDDRVRLYKESIDLLLTRWNTRTHDQPSLREFLALPDLKDENIEKAIFEIAYRAHAAEPGARTAGAGDSSGDSDDDRDEPSADITESDLRAWIRPLSWRQRPARRALHPVYPRARRAAGASQERGVHLSPPQPAGVSGRLSPDAQRRRRLPGGRCGVGARGRHALARGLCAGGRP